MEGSESKEGVKSDQFFGNNGALNLIPEGQGKLGKGREGKVHKRQ